MEAPEEAASLRLLSHDGAASDENKEKKEKPRRYCSPVWGGLWCLPILVLGLLGPVSWLLAIYFSIDITLASSLAEQPLESASLGCNTLAEEAQRLGVTNLLWQGSCNNFDGISDILDKSAYVDLITLLTILIARQQNVETLVDSTFAQDTGCYDRTSKKMYYVLSVVIFLLAMVLPRSFGSNSHSGKEAKMYRPIKEIATRFAFDRRLNNPSKDPEMHKGPNVWETILTRAKFWDSANRPENLAVLDSWDHKWRYIRDKMKPARSLALGGQKFANPNLQALLELTENEEAGIKQAAEDSSRHSESNSPKRSLESSVIPEAEKRVREAEDLMNEKMANVEGAFDKHKMSVSHSFGRAASQLRAESELAAAIEVARDAAQALTEAGDHLNQLRANQRESANCAKRNGGRGPHEDPSMTVMEAMIEKASDNDHQWTFCRWISGKTDRDGRADGKEADEDQKYLRRSAERYVKNRIDRWAKWSLISWIICWLAMSAHLVFLIFIPAKNDFGRSERLLSDTPDTNHACVRLSTILERNPIAFGGACMDTRSLGEVLGVLETTVNIQNELSKVDSVLSTFVFSGNAWSRFRQQSRVCTPQPQKGKGFVKGVLGPNVLRAFSLPTIVFPSYFTFAYAPVTQRYMIPRLVYDSLGKGIEHLISWYRFGISQGSKVLPIVKALGAWGNAGLFILGAVGVTVIALSVEYLPTLLGDLEAIPPGTLTAAPTLSTFAPTNSPTQAPTPFPVLSPVFVPTMQPTVSPSTSPVASEDMHLTKEVIGIIAGAIVGSIVLFCLVFACRKSGLGDAGSSHLLKTKKRVANGLPELVYLVVAAPFLLVVGIGALPFVLLGLGGYIGYYGAKGLWSGGESLWRRAKVVGAFFWTQFIRPRLPDPCELCDLEFNRYRRWYKCQDHYCKKHRYRHGTSQTPLCPKCDDETVELCDCTKKLNRPPLRECDVCFCITHEVRKTEFSSRAICGEPHKVCRFCDCPNHAMSRARECVNCFCLQHDEPLTETRDGERGCTECFCKEHPNIKLVIKDGDAENKEHCSKCNCTHGRIRETCKKCWCPKHGAKVDLWCASCKKAHRIDDLAWARGCRMPHECLSCLKGCQRCRDIGMPESDVPWRESCLRHWCGKHGRSEIPREHYAENEKCSVCHDPCKACKDVPNSLLPARQECSIHWCTEHGRSMCVICSGEELVCPYCTDDTGVYKTRKECNEECNDHWCHDEQHRDSYHDELKDGDIESRGDHMIVDAEGFVDLTQFSGRCPVCTDPCRECFYGKKRVRTSCNDHFCVDVHKNPKVLLGGEWRCERCDDPCLRCQERGKVPPLRTQCEAHFCQVHKRTVEWDSSDRKCIVCTYPCCHENQARIECEQCYCEKHESFLCEFLDNCAGGFCPDCNCVYCKAPLDRGNSKVRDADRFDTDRCKNCEGFCHHVKDPRACTFCWCFFHNKARLIKKADEDLIDGHYRPCPDCKPCEHAVYCREACDECFCQRHEIYKIARYPTDSSPTKPDASQKRFCPSCGEIPGPLTRKRFCKFTAKLFNCRQMVKGSAKRYTWIDILDHVTADRQSPSTSIWTQAGVRKDQNFEEIFEAIRAAQQEIESFVDTPPGVQASRMWLVYNPGSPDMRLDQGEARRTERHEEGGGNEEMRKLQVQELFHAYGSQWVKSGEDFIRHDPAADILFASDYREIASYGCAESKEPRFDYRTVFSSEVLRKRLSEMEFERLQETIDSGPRTFFERTGVKIQEEENGYDAEGREEDLYLRLIERRNEENRERHV